MFFSNFLFSSSSFVSDTNMTYWLKPKTLLLHSQRRLNHFTDKISSWCFRQTQELNRLTDCAHTHTQNGGINWIDQQCNQILVELNIKYNRIYLDIWQLLAQQCRWTHFFFFFALGRRCLLFLSLSHTVHCDVNLTCLSIKKWTKKNKKIKTRSTISNIGHFNRLNWIQFKICLLCYLGKELRSIAIWTSGRVVFSVFQYLILIRKTLRFQMCATFGFI